MQRGPLQVLSKQCLLLLYTFSFQVIHACPETTYTDTEDDGDYKQHNGQQCSAHHNGAANKQADIVVSSWNII